MTGTDSEHGTAAEPHAALRRQVRPVARQGDRNLDEVVSVSSDITIDDVGLCSRWITVPAEHVLTQMVLMVHVFSLPRMQGSC